MSKNSKLSFISFITLITITFEKHYFFKSILYIIFKSHLLLISLVKNMIYVRLYIIVFIVNNYCKTISTRVKLIDEME